MDRYQKRVLRLRKHVLSQQKQNDNAEGFIPTEDDNTDEVEIEEKDFIFKVGIDDISKDKIIEILKQKDIDHNPRDKKEVLYNLMIEGD